MCLRTILFLTVTPLIAQQHSETALTNPFNSPDDRMRGAVFFKSQCASCHGADAKGGGNGPNLASGTFRHASSDEGLFKIITKGVAGTAMPGFSLNGREIWQIVAYVRSLSSTQPSSQAPGDAAKGQALVREKGCLNCHWISGEGTERGVSLGFGRSSTGELRQSILDPDADVAPEFWGFLAVTHDGKTIKGRRLNEDTFSVQVLLPGGQLASIPKSSLREQTLERRSPMPAFRGKLSEAELNDIVAYLSSLRSAAR